MQMSYRICGMLRAACLGKLPDIHNCNNTTLWACLLRGYFELALHNVKVTPAGFEAYETMKDATAPLRKHTGELAKSVLGFANRDLRTKLLLVSKKVA